MRGRSTGRVGVAGLGDGFFL
uniref:Uncharacterized protein n=1 Tax=Arundo donax TaxID=35708 RepID=A0A0A9HCN1_ARUDO